MVEGLEELLEKVNNLPDKERYEALLEIRSKTLILEDKIKTRNLKDYADGFTEDSASLIAREAKTVLDGEINCDMMISPSESYEFISLYDYLNYLSNSYKKWQELITKCEKKIYSSSHYIKGSYNYYNYIRIGSFTPSKNKMEVIPALIVFSTHHEYPFAVYKENGRMSCGNVIDSQNELFNKAKDTLSLVYDELLENYKYNVQDIEGAFNIFGTNFYIFHDSECTHLKNTNSYADLLTISFDKCKVKFKGEMLPFDNITKGYEIKLLSNMYLKIADLPSKFQEDLRKLRSEKQLEEKRPFIKKIFG